MTGGPHRLGAHVAVVGASLAGVRAATSLRKLGFDGQLTLVDAESDEPYDRPPLSKGFLARTLNASDIRLRDADRLDATWFRGRRAIGASMADQIVRLDDGTTVNFDGLIIATGVRPRTGLDVLARGAAAPDGVHVLRSLSDATRLRQALSGSAIRICVIGCGFIGTEVAATARQLGHTVSMIDRAPVPLTSAVGETAGGFVADLHHQHGVDLHLGVPVRELEMRDRELAGVIIDDHTAVPANLVVIGLGASPNVDWLHHSGVLLDNGVRTDASLRVLDTSGVPIPRVAAVGDVARWPHPLFDDEPVRLEHWSNATDHAPVAARTVWTDLTGEDDSAVCESVPSFWSNQYDRKLMSVGLPHLGEESDVLDGQITDGRFVVGFGRRGRLVGAVGVDSPRTLATYRRIIARRGPWPPPVNSPPVALGQHPQPARQG